MAVTVQSDVRLFGPIPVRKRAPRLHVQDSLTVAGIACRSTSQARPASDSPDERIHLNKEERQISHEPYPVSYHSTCLLLYCSSGAAQTYLVSRSCPPPIYMTWCALHCFSSSPISIGFKHKLTSVCGKRSVACCLKKMLKMHGSSGCCLSW